MTDAAPRTTIADRAEPRLFGVRAVHHIDFPATAGAGFDRPGKPQPR